MGASCQAQRSALPRAGRAVSVVWRVCAAQNPKIMNFLNVRISESRCGEEGMGQICSFGEGGADGLVGVHSALFEATLCCLASSDEFPNFKISNKNVERRVFQLPRVLHGSISMASKVRSP